MWLIQSKLGRKKAMRDEVKKLSRDQTVKGLMCFAKLRGSDITLRAKWTHPKGLRCSLFTETLYVS